MSRIGKLPIPLPAGVEVTQSGGKVVVTGPRGTLERVVASGIAMEVRDGRVHVERGADDQQSRALHGLTRSLVANMVKGVSDGYEKVLDVVGVGYRVELVGKAVRMQVGYSHLVEVHPRPGITFEVGQETNNRQFFLRVKGIDKELVGQQAAEIRSLKKPEPYKGKGIRYRGEAVRRKAGKSAKGGKGGKK
ncbi:MAG: 50S ribosomal protein L6 [Armatimonadetes bacterium]|nr:50S ribosomal protein L6 [Armatimonadota bacterium]